MSVQERWYSPEQQPQPIWIVSPAGDDFQVYDPSNREHLYTVGGTPDAPTCTCEAFAMHRREPGWQCDHIRAVFRHVRGGETDSTNGPAQASCKQSNGQHAVGNGLGDGDAPCMLSLKRSVSPDGRIDSLSIELQAPVWRTGGELEEQAQAFMDAQARIASAFLENGPGRMAAAPLSSDGAVAARLTNVAGMQTRWGWRTFINVEVEGGERHKLFGSRKQLAEHLAQAGYPHLGSNLSSGTILNASCRAILKPTDDGKYTNVERILPPAGNGR